MIRLFRLFIPVGTFTLLVSDAVLVTAAFVVAAYAVTETDATVFLLYDGGLAGILVMVLSILIGFCLQDLYSDALVKPRAFFLPQLCVAVGGAFVLQGFVGYLDAGLRVPIRIALVGSALAVVASVAWRLFLSVYASSALGGERVLFVGGNPLLKDIASFSEDHPGTGFVVAGYVDDTHEVGASLPGGKVLGPVASLREIVWASQPKRIVVGMFEQGRCAPIGELLELRFAGHVVEEAGAVCERVCGRVSIGTLRPSRLIFSGGLDPLPERVFRQRLWNTALAAIGIVVTFPIMGLTAIAVRLSSPGPVLDRQVRVGLNGVPFQLYRFRSMRADAQTATHTAGPIVTRVSRLLRKMRVDGLPQLFNVLRGEMFVVGPRPERPEFVKELAEYVPFYHHRYSVRPGVTGWAQINGMDGDAIEDTITNLEYDLCYIKNISLGLDFFIFYRALNIMLWSHKAH